MLGVTFGNVIANLYGGLGYIDIIGGTVANFLAAYIGWKVGSRRFTGAKFLATVVMNLIVSGIVGGYLAVLFDIPLEIGLLGILAGSIVSMNILGYILVLAIERSGLATKYFRGKPKTAKLP